jgi:hypothetical protein
VRALSRPPSSCRCVRAPGARDGEKVQRRRSSPSHARAAWCCARPPPVVLGTDSTGLLLCQRQWWWAAFGAGASSKSGFRPEGRSSSTAGCEHGFTDTSADRLAARTPDHQAVHRHGSPLQRQRQPPPDAVAGVRPGRAFGIRGPRAGSLAQRLRARVIEIALLLVCGASVVLLVGGLSVYTPARPAASPESAACMAPCRAPGGRGACWGGARGQEEVFRIWGFCPDAGAAREMRAKP